MNNASEYVSNGADRACPILSLPHGTTGWGSRIYHLSNNVEVQLNGMHMDRYHACFATGESRARGEHEPTDHKQ